MKKTILLLGTFFLSGLIVFMTVIYFVLSGYLPEYINNNKYIGEELGFVGLVNTFHGTGGHPLSSGATFPGASYPFGMVQLSPDTQYSNWLMRSLSTFNMANAGYYYGHDSILGFSHTRISGGGIPSGGVIRVRPSRNPSPEAEFRERIKFKHEKEVAYAGSYNVDFEQLGVKVSLTAGKQIGVHRYDFSGEEPKSLLIDLSSVNGAENTVTGVKVDFDHNSKVFRGEIKVLDSFSKSYGGFTLYFALRVSNMTSYYYLQDHKNLKAAAASGNDLGIAVIIEKNSNRAEMTIGLSLSTVSDALAQLEETPTFSEQIEATRNQWNALLSRIEVQSQDKEFLKLFYTSLYHSLLMPNLSSGGVNPKYTNYSLWDTFRATHPLFDLAYKDYQKEFITSLMEMTKSNKFLPRWPYQTGETNIMIGSPSVIVMAEAAKTGFLKLETDIFLEIMESILNDSDLSICLEHGHCPGDLMSGSVSKAIEYSWAFHSLVNWKSSLGGIDGPTLSKGLNLWKAHWHEGSQSFLPKDSQGKWMGDSAYWLGSVFGGGHYTEGSKYHWRWGIPHKKTVKDLIGLFGSEEKFIDLLEDFFEKGSANALGAMIPSTYYWHGNEHNLHAPFLFNFTSKPYLSQKWVNWILKNRYKNGPHGLDGNDDGGTLGSWFVWASLGLFQLPGSSTLTITSPLVEQAKVFLTPEKQLNIFVDKDSSDAHYIEAVYLDGHRLCEPFLGFKQLHDAEKLEFKLGDKPAGRSGFDCL